MRWAVALVIAGLSALALDAPAGPRPYGPMGPEGGSPAWCPLPIGAAQAGGTQEMDPVQKSDAEWRRQLTPQQYQVTRQGGTEPAFTGRYWDHKAPGVYRCVACGLELYRSDTKYESGTGWPSFWAPADERRLRYELDASHGMRRTEVRCARCGAHLGHLFEDGPPPTGQRHCINSAALDFTPAP